MPTSRRDFLQGTAVSATVAAGLLRPATARAESDRLFSFAREQRRRQRIVRQEALGLSQRPLAKLSEGMRDRMDAIVAGMASFTTLRAVQEISLHDQAHPAVQELLEDTATEVGGAMVASHELLEGWLASEDPDREDKLRAALGTIRGTLDSWPVPPARQHQLMGRLLRLERARGPKALERQVRRLARRLGRVRALVPELEARGEVGSPVEDPAAMAEIEAGQATWRGLGLPSGGARARRTGTGATALGIIILVLGVVVGGVLVLTGLCLVVCGAPAGLLVMLLGLAIVAGAVYAYIALSKADDGEASGEADGASSDEVARAAGIAHPEPLATHRVRVEAGASWLATGLRRDRESCLSVSARGVARVDGLAPSSPDGHPLAAGPGALVPEAPLGALVGRIGTERFFLGAEARVPEGPAGELLLAVNHREAPRGQGLGSIEVDIATYSLGLG